MTLETVNKTVIEVEHGVQFLSIFVSEDIDKIGEETMLDDYDVDIVIRELQAWRNRKGQT